MGKVKQLLFMQMEGLQMINKREIGQTLIEVLVAMSVMGIVVTAIALTIITTLNNTSLSRNQSSAVAYTQEGMETIRRLREEVPSFSTFYAGTYCLDKNSTTLTNAPCDVNVDDIYVRQVEITPNSSNCTPLNPTPTPTATPTPTPTPGPTLAPDITPTETPIPTATPTPLPQPTPYPSSTKVTVSVCWTDSKCENSTQEPCGVDGYCHVLPLVSCFTDRDIVPTP